VAVRSESRFYLTNNQVKRYYKKNHKKTDLIMKVYNKMLTIKLTKEQYTFLKKMSRDKKKMGKTKSEVMRRILDQYMIRYYQKESDH